MSLTIALMLVFLELLSLPPSFAMTQYALLPLKQGLVIRNILYRPSWLAMNILLKVRSDANNDADDIDVDNDYDGDIAETRIEVITMTIMTMLIMTVEYISKMEC